MSRTLIVFNRRLGRVLESHRISGSTSEAVSKRLDLEDQYRNQENIEIVVLTAESEDALRDTHGRYFESLHDLADQAIARLG
jgi:hypothetical protein